MELPDLPPQAICRVLLDDSPCDSPIEDLFYYDFQKVMSDRSIIHRQIESPTTIGTFRLDFLFQLPGRRIGFECDGKEFHDAAKDAIRDRAIIDAGHAERIYRLRGYDIHFHLHDAFHLTATHDPEIFSERGQTNIKALASREYERLDDSLYPDEFFSFAATRYYGRQRGPDDDSEYSDERPQFTKPTVVYWTQK